MLTSQPMANKHGDGVGDKWLPLKSLFQPFPFRHSFHSFTLLQDTATSGSLFFFRLYAQLVDWPQTK